MLTVFLNFGNRPIKFHLGEDPAILDYKPRAADNSLSLIIYDIYILWLSRTTKYIVTNSWIKCISHKIHVMRLFYFQALKKKTWYSRYTFSINYSVYRLFTARHKGEKCNF